MYHVYAQVRNVPASSVKICPGSRDINTSWERLANAAYACAENWQKLAEKGVKEGFSFVKPSDKPVKWSRVTQCPNGYSVTLFPCLKDEEQVNMEFTIGNTRGLY